MLESLDILARSRPHLYENARFNVEQARFYELGYYEALRWATKCLQMTYDHIEASEARERAAKRAQNRERARA